MKYKVGDKARDENTFNQMYLKSEEIYNKEYSTGEYCHEQSFKWGFQEGDLYGYKRGIKDCMDLTSTYLLDIMSMGAVDRVMRYLEEHFKEDTILFDE